VRLALAAHHGFFATGVTGSKTLWICGDFFCMFFDAWLHALGASGGLSGEIMQMIFITPLIYPSANATEMYTSHSIPLSAEQRGMHGT
jgi:hypothetical protein